MPDNSINDTVEYLTRLILESKNISNETPQSLVRLYKETYNQIKDSLNAYNKNQKNSQKIQY